MVRKPGAILIALALLLASAVPSASAAQEVPQLRGEAEQGDDVLDYRARRELIRYEPFEPLGVPDVPIGSRTVFFEERDPEALRLEVLIQPAAEVTAVPGAVFRAAGWISAPEVERRERLGEVIGFAADQGVRLDRDTVHPYDEVRIRLVGDSRPGVGEDLLLYRIDREVEGVGEIVAPTGRVRIIRTNPDGDVVGQVIQEYDRVQVGQLVGRVRTFPILPGVHPAESDLGIEARLLTFQEEKELHLPGDFAFIDRGRADGLAVGDEFFAFVGEGPGWEGRVVGSFQVVGISEATATVRLAQVGAPASIRPGLRLMLHRKMP